MTNVLFIVNPRAGQQSLEAFRAALADEPALRSGGMFRAEVLVPESPEQMRADLRLRFERDPDSLPDVLAVVGGDGSVMEALPLVVEFPRIRLALVPQGTGNLLAINLGIPVDPHDALRLVFDSHESVSRAIDVGRIGTHQYFALLAGVGAVADIMENTRSRHKKLLGMWAYLTQGVRAIFRARQSLFRVTVDGRLIKSRGVAVIVSNAARSMQPCPSLTPDAQPDDGQLDVCLIKARSRRDYLPTLWEALRHGRRHARDRRIRLFKGRRIRIESAPVLKLQADGNIIGTTPVEIEIVRNRVRVLVPRVASPQVQAPVFGADGSSLAEILSGYFPPR